LQRGQFGPALDLNSVHLFHRPMLISVAERVDACLRADPAFARSSATPGPSLWSASHVWSTARNGACLSAGWLSGSVLSPLTPAFYCADAFANQLQYSPISRSAEQLRPTAAVFPQFREYARTARDAVRAGRLRKSSSADVHGRRPATRHVHKKSHRKLSSQRFPAVRYR
jgi:hypothetical protein